MPLSDFFSHRNNKKQLRTDGGTIEQYLCRPTAKFEKTFLPPLLALPRKHEKNRPFQVNNHKTNAYNDCYEAVPKRPHGLDWLSELKLFRIPARRQCYLVVIAEASCPLF